MEVSWRGDVTNKELMETAHMQEVLETVRILKLRFSGRMLRLSENRTERQAKP